MQVGLGREGERNIRDGMEGDALGGFTCGGRLCSSFNLTSIAGLLNTGRWLELGNMSR